MKLILIFILVICAQPAKLKVVDNNVLEDCKSILARVESVEAFLRFMVNLKASVSRFESSDDGKPQLEANTESCLDKYNVLRKLEFIVRQRKHGVCRMDYVNKLIDFHLKYIVQTSHESQGGTKLIKSEEDFRFIRRFFSLFVHQVVYTCKTRMVGRLENIENKNDCFEVMSSFLPLDNDEDKMASKALEFLEQFQRVEDFFPASLPGNPSQLSFDVIISPEVIGRMEELKSICRSNAPFYRALFTPIATLSQFGYSTESELSDPKSQTEDENPNLLRCWLAKGQLCEGILRTHLIINNDAEVTEEAKLVKLELTKPGYETDANFTTEIFVDSFDEISPQIVNIVNKKRSFMSKIKNRVLKWTKNMLLHHASLNHRDAEDLNEFIYALTKDKSNSDHAVAFAGKPVKTGMYNPTSLVTDDVDTFVGWSSFFLNPALSKVASCVVGIVLSGAFLVFSVHALVLSIKQQSSQPDDTSLKLDWRKLRDARQEKLKKKVNLQRWTDKFKVYKNY